jgi:acyl dehydratase
MADRGGGSVPVEGAVATAARPFTREDVEAFAAISGDRGQHTVEPGEDGRVLVHGLLRAVLPTQIGGDRDFLARTMTYEFHRPVRTGEEVTCEMTTDEVVEREDRYEVASSAVCRNEAGDRTTTAEFRGIVRKDP